MRMKPLWYDFSTFQQLLFRNGPAKGIIGVPASRRQASMVCFDRRESFWRYPEIDNQFSIKSLALWSWKTSYGSISTCITCSWGLKRIFQATNAGHNSNQSTMGRKTLKGLNFCSQQPVCFQQLEYSLIYYFPVSSKRKKNK